MKKMAWSISWMIESSILKSNKADKNINSTEKVKDNVESLINFNDYKEDIEAFMFIDRENNIYDKKAKRLDLTNLVFWTIRGMLKDHFEDFISHPDFKDIIFKIYWLKWDFKINFSSEDWNESFVLINITDSRRFWWFSSSEVDWFIFKRLKLIDQTEITHFLREVIYWIDDSLEKYSWLWFKQFIYSNIFIKVNELLEKNNDLDKIFLNWNDWIVDKKMFIKSMSWKLYRDNFEYIHKIAGHKLMSELPKLVLDELLSNHSEDLKETINNNFDEIILFLSKYKEENRNILDIEDKLKNNILINFQDRIKFYFKKINNTELDWNLLKWAIAYLIENNNLSLNIWELAEAIFKLLDENIDDLEKLFLKYDWNIVEEEWKKYKYLKFQIRDLDSQKSYSVKNILSIIKLVRDELLSISNDIENIKKQMDNAKVNNYHYIWNLDIKKQELVDIDNKINEIVKEREKIELEMAFQNNKWMLKKIISNNDKSIIELNNRTNHLYDKLVKLTIKYEWLSMYIVWIEERVSWLNQSYNNLIRKLKDLELMYKNKSLMLERIREDFMWNILFWREEIK